MKKQKSVITNVNQYIRHHNFIKAANDPLRRFEAQKYNSMYGSWQSAKDAYEHTKESDKTFDKISKRS